jgi:hypothetical protein
VNGAAKEYAKLEIMKKQTVATKPARIIEPKPATVEPGVVTDYARKAIDDFFN